MKILITILLALFISTSANSNWATITDICSDYFTELSVTAGNRMENEKQVFELEGTVKTDAGRSNIAYIKELIAKDIKTEYELAKMYHYLNCSTHLNADNHLYHR